MKNIFYNISFATVVLGGLSWGLIGLGSFLSQHINILARLSFGNTLIEYLIYFFIGIMTLIFIFLSRTE
jgi:uncharacterized membrane protein YuzA (DUF378 family)